MPEIQTKIIILSTDGRGADVFPTGTVDTDQTVGTILRDVKNELNLPDDLELFVKVSPDTKLNSLKMEHIESVAILPVTLKRKSSFSTGQK